MRRASEMYKRPLVYSCTRRVPAVCRHGRRSFVFPGRMKKPGGGARSDLRTQSRAARWRTWVASRRDATRRPASRERAGGVASSPFVKTLYCRPPGAVFKARTRMYTGRKSAPLQFYTYIKRAGGSSFMITRGREKIRDRTWTSTRPCFVHVAPPPPPAHPLTIGPTLTGSWNSANPAGFAGPRRDTCQKRPRVANDFILFYLFFFFCNSLRVSPDFRVRSSPLEIYARIKARERDNSEISRYLDAMIFNHQMRAIQRETLYFPSEIRLPRRAVH